MIRASIGWVLLIIASLVAPLRSAEAANTTISVRDDSGRIVSLSAPATRIIALAPNLTELVYAAGGGDRLVGVTRFSDFPAAARSVPQIGDAFALNFEAIVLLKPDLVIAWKSGLGQRQRERLQSLGLTVFDSEIGSVEEIAAALRTFGALMGTGDTAEPVATELDRRWSDLKSRYAGRSSLRVFYELSEDPLMTVNGRHLISRTIEACGGVNPFAALPLLAPVIGWEAAARANPQLIAMAGTSGPSSHLGRWPTLPSIDAVRLNQYAILPPDLLSRMGPRFVDGAELLCKAMDVARKAYPR